jgi:hypothetical protein
MLRRGKFSGTETWLMWLIAFSLSRRARLDCPGGGSKRMEDRFCRRGRGGAGSDLSHRGDPAPPALTENRAAREQRKNCVGFGEGHLCRVNLSALAVIHAHSDSIVALRIVFSICLVIVLFAGLYVFRIRKSLFDRDPQVAADHWAARNLRLWQVILVWLLAVDLLMTMLWRL